MWIIMKWWQLAVNTEKVLWWNVSDAIKYCEVNQDKPDEDERFGYFFIKKT